MGHRAALGADRPLGAERAHVRRLRDCGGLRSGARVGRVGGDARADARSAGSVSWACAAQVDGRAQRRSADTVFPNPALRGPAPSTGSPPPERCPARPRDSRTLPYAADLAISPHKGAFGIGGGAIVSVRGRWVGPAPAGAAQNRTLRT